MSLVDTIENDAEKALAYAAPLITALEVIQSMTGIGGAVTAEALQAAQAAVNKIAGTALGGLAANVDPTIILADLAKLQASVTTDDANADAALAARFGG